MRSKQFPFPACAGLSSLLDTYSKMDPRLYSFDKISALFIILLVPHTVIGLPVVVDLDLFEPLQPVLGGDVL
jgi:hypothetical protein